MASTLPVAPAIATPFANLASARNEIPAITQAVSGGATLQQGFPPECSLPISGGGIPPSRLDMNGMAYVATFPQYFLEQGGYYTYDANVASAIGGYPKGAVLTYYDSANKVIRKLRSLVANNSRNFVTSPSVIGNYWEDVTPVIGTGRKYFDVFYSFSDDAPYGAVPLDGRELTATNYPGFCARAKELKAANKIRTLTAAQYNTALTNYGQTGGFVLTTSGGDVTKVKLPTLNGFIQCVSSGGSTGKVHSAGLPNITGTIWGEGKNEPVWSTVTGAFFKTTTSGQRGKTGADNDNTNIGFNANSGATVKGIYGGATTVQPRSVELRLYIQVIEGNISGGGGTSGGVTPAEVIDLVSSGGYTTSGAVLEMISSGGGGGGVDPEQVIDIVSSGGYVTSGAVTEIVNAGGYATSGAVTTIIGSSGYVTAASASQIASTVFGSGGTISGGLTVSGALVAIAGNASWFAAQRTVDSDANHTYPYAEHAVSSNGASAGFRAGTDSSTELFFGSGNYQGAISLAASNAVFYMNSNGAESPDIRVSATFSGIAFSYDTFGTGELGGSIVHSGGVYSNTVYDSSFIGSASLTSNGATLYQFVSNNGYNTSEWTRLTLMHGSAFMWGYNGSQLKQGYLPNDSDVMRLISNNAITSDAEFSTTVGGYTVALTSGGGLVVSGSGASVVLNSGSVTVNSRPVLTQLATSTDTETTSANFPVLDGGTSYIYTQPLTNLDIASVTSDCDATIKFTAGASLSGIGLPSSCYFTGESAFTSGSHYLAAFNGADVVIIEQQKLSEA